MARTVQRSWQPLLSGTGLVLESAGVWNKAVSGKGLLSKMSRIQYASFVSGVSCGQRSARLANASSDTSAAAWSFMLRGRCQRGVSARAESVRYPSIQE